MPIYRCTVPVGLLGTEEKSRLANDIVDIHCGLTSGTPRAFVHVIFEEFEAGNAFVGGAPSEASTIVGLIRAGRTQETRSALLTALVKATARITGQSEAEILVVLTEARPQDVMEWGQIAPEDGEEAAWVAKHGMESHGLHAT